MKTNKEASLGGALSNVKSVSDESPEKNFDGKFANWGGFPRYAMLTP
jgi:hypothetical protein